MWTIKNKAGLHCVPGIGKIQESVWILIRKGENMMGDLKAYMANDFKIVTNEYLLLIPLMLVGSAFVPFSFLWMPVLGLMYLLVMFYLLFRGLDKMLYLSVFDKTSSAFEGYLENIPAALVSKCFVSATGLIEILLLPAGALALTVSMGALEWQEVIEWYGGFCSENTAVKTLVFAELLNLAASCILTGSMLMLVTVCMAKIFAAAKSQAIREAVRIVGYLICVLAGVAIYLWWMLAGLENSLIYCVVSIVVKLGLCAALIPVLKKRVITVYESL